jgi:hypothetical protein
MKNRIGGIVSLVYLALILPFHVNPTLEWKNAKEDSIRAIKTGRWRP